MSLTDKFHCITTVIINRQGTNISQGTGFFYHGLGEKNPDSPEWVTIENLWLVTNKHVVINKIDGKEYLPDSLIFHLRKYETDHFEWHPIELNREELLKRVRVHENSEVDVCTISIFDLVMKISIDDKKYYKWFGVSKENLPGQNKIEPEPTDEAVVIGYPRGFYDETNLFPIIKSGIIASGWDMNFNNKPYFLIDAKLFPGSSGSIVITKPINIVVSEGQIFQSPEKQFAFLGIYSGEPVEYEKPIELDDITIVRKYGYNVGIVWYGSLVEDIIKRDLFWKET